MSSDALPETQLSATGFTLPLSRISKEGITTVKQGFFAETSHVALENANEFAYLIPVGIGGQFFDVIFDTGSSDLWIVDSSCTDQDCQLIAKYQPTHNLVLTDAAFNLTYLTGNVSGTIGSEAVLFGPYLIFSQILALVNSTTDMGLSATRVSGVLGLAFPSEASIPISIGRTLLENIFANLDPAYRFFAYKLSADAAGNSFSVGQLDPKYINQTSEITYSPVYVSDGADYDYWKLPLLSISVNSESIPFALSPSKVPGSLSPIAVLDTGTTLILGPTHDVDNFWTVAGGAQKGPDGSWQVRCDHAVSVSLVLGNESVHGEYAVDPVDMSWMSQGNPSDGWCLGGIQSNDGVFSGDWLLGDVFLRNVYVVHQISTSSTPPLIGLLSTTNAPQALARFQAGRGNDTTAIPVIRAKELFHRPSPPNAVLILTSTLIFAFLGSALLTILVRIKREKGGKRRTRVKGIHNLSH